MSGYERAPLVEALCEFQFVSAPDHAWDWTLPGQFYERVKDRFPGRTEARHLDRAVGPTLAARSHERIQFRRPAGDMIVQLGRDLLAVNSLVPHTGWEGLRDTTLAMLKTYREMAAPAALTMCAVRYVNQVDIPVNDEFALEAYFTVLPVIPSGMPSHVANFMAQTESIMETPSAVLRFRFGTSPEPANHASFIVDLEHVAPGEMVPTFDNLSIWLEAAHSRITEVFKSTFTDKAHNELFRRGQA